MQRATGGLWRVVATSTAEPSAEPSAGALQKALAGSRARTHRLKNPYSRIRQLRRKALFPFSTLAPFFFHRSAYFIFAFPRITSKCRQLADDEDQNDDEW
jgi:hypothetical protein